ncbi:MAG: bifunctional 5,10-methylenetetrahydrofolate dehydrogenase/5,10-methenyltetrahydrofolate cyclohydrolase [Oscillospiraceae bacterium]|jgi:methylenetetrahydrofolate dehydrogenase (NADP+)/methenyltetrahydrofolate cyclohydrolase|nr:bifunctional 5,10-methylenetetrahydrofolate dehydrogenase/5,10-methenyltetrahydrofolate cyclohydrolase [Oscillospiraceae bacterium]
MPATKLTAKPVADALTEKVTAQIAALKTKGVTPTLAILRVGERADDLSYEKGALKRCETVGMAVKQVVLPQDVAKDDLLGAVKELNADDGVHGVLIFRPLPFEKDVFDTLDPKKDIDGATDASTALLFNGFGGTVFGGGEGPKPENSAFPCTPAACMAILDHYGYGDVKGKNVAFVGSGLRVGRPLGILLLNRGATITYCHEFTENTAEICSAADVIVVAVGRANLIGESHMKPGQVIIDAGLSVGADGKMVGDTDQAAAEKIGVSYTPSVGAVTTAVLVSHVVDAAAKTLK